ncbi:FecR domain-containing protein [Sphingobacterium sp.]|uniref:FecR family protein n=1 Tax=Sphingobacterium sp. TaxID=341027 RepID=UPI002899AAA7|nr:FecR domain-containing protein [Sphingobacterium sp.]
MKEPLKVDRDLLKRYTSDQCTDREKAFVDDWYIAHVKQLPDFELSAEELQADLSDTWNSIDAEIHMPQQSRSNWKKWFAAAASICLIGFSSYYFLIYHYPSTPADSSSTIRATEVKTGSSFNQKTSPILPATSGAMLVLSNGEQIALDKNNGSSNRKDHEILIDWSDNNELVYQADDSKNNSQAVLTNTLVVPKGNTYKIRLADGTQVTLNADSKLIFPIQFTGTKREVTLEGEGYFEVSKRQISAGNKTIKQEFIVHAGQNAVQVLGTRFNVKAYPDDKQHSFTLEEGSIALNNPANPAPILLKPGQKIIQTGNEFTLLKVDLSKDLSWKNGDFYFDSATVQEIMAQISRWYNIEVAYLGPINNQQYISSISRKKTLQEVLEILETTTGIKFDIRIKGKERRLMVIP